MSSNRKLVLAGQIAFLPTGILTTLLGPMLPILMARWALNDTQAGNLFLVQFLSSLVGVQLAGFCWPVGISSVVPAGSAVDGVRDGHSLYGIALAGTDLGGGLWPWTGLIIPTDNLLIAEISSGSVRRAPAR